ncbi:MAG: glycosyltransferase family 2 protein [Bdellovibrionaceae bacterium]|nr:glycosyltransferase family 2 protein [Pseudobdellovibrionaceae bacterium]
MAESPAPHFREYSESLVSIVVPVFNEAANIVSNLDLLIGEIEEHFKRFEILVVSDGSTDGTNLNVFSFKDERIRLLVSERNAGKGNAVRRGFQNAIGDYIFFIDGGMELHPKEIRIFFGLMSLYEADIVIGSKRHPQSKVYYPLIRRILSGIYQRLVKVMFSVDATDTQVGIKLFRKEVISAILPDLRIDRYGFDLEILTLAKIHGFSRILEAPVQMDYFLRNRRALPIELAHIFKVGTSLLIDTLKLYRRTRRLKLKGK